MRNEVIYDKNGRPDIMVVFKPSELGLPDTLRGRKVKEYAISKYQNTLIDGVPYSLPFMKPAVNISHDEAIRLCESKGEGWHLITNDEWVALGFWSWDNDTMPTGNTASGKSHSHPEQTGTTYEGGCGKTLTGSGPVQWNHDGTAYGVADMSGNIWEHVGGVRFMDGMPQVIPNNGAAYGADQSKDSPEWEAIYTEDGDPVYYNVHNGEITLQPVHPDGTDYDGVKFTDLEVRSDMDAPDRLKDLGLYPADDYESDEYFWLDSNGERVIYRGGYWSHGSSAGVFALGGDYSRSYATANLGFRAACVRFICDSDTLDDLDSDKKQPEPKKRSILAPDFIGRIKQALARQFQKLYEAAHGEDPEGFAELADSADVFVKLPEGERIPQKIVELTGITDEQLENEGITEAEAAARFTELIGGGRVLLVAHNAQFDLLFTAEMLRRHGNGGPEALKAADYLDSLTVYKDRRAYPHKLANAILTYKLEDKVQNSHRAIDDVAALFEVCKAMDAERSDLLSYVNVFGYNPKYGVSGKRIEKVAYWPQNFNKYMQAPSYTLPAKLRQRRR